MVVVGLHRKDEIEAFVRRDPRRHLFELGDLDDRYWAHTVWYGLEEGGALCQLALVYTATPVSILLANPEPPADQMRELLRGLLPLLPRRFYAHLDPAQVDVLADAYAIHRHGLHYRMVLADPSPLGAVDTSAVTLLMEADVPALEALYR